jgi:hypothetical protein
MPNQLKQSLLSRIAALKALNTGFPTLSTNNSLPSLNSSNNALDFLLDLIKTLVGFDELKNEFIRFLTYQVQPIESTLKELLKNLLKETFSCNIDAIIPEYLINNGFNISVKQIDLFNLFKINPSSEFGSLSYGSTQQDLNNFLYQVIANSGSTNWKGILTVEYLESGTVEGELRNDVLNIKINSNYSGKSINDFINDFLDSIVILQLPLFINRIFDILYGIFSFSKDNRSLELENEVITLVEKIIELPEIDIDNSYYEFNTKDKQRIEELTNNRRNGIFKFKTCNNIESSLDLNDLLNLTNDLNNTSTLIEQKTVIENRFATITEAATQNVDNNNKNLAGLDLYGNFFKSVAVAILTLLISPKVILLFSIYFKVVNTTIGFKNARDFINDNRTFFIKIIRDVVLPIVIEFLLTKVLKIIKDLIVQDNVNRITEQANNYKIQLFSLLGVSQRIRNLINSI